MTKYRYEWDGNDRVVERFDIMIPEKDGLRRTYVRVTNDGTKSFKDQSEQARKDLAKHIIEKLGEGDKSGWLPYNNFESSIEWKVR